MENEREESQGGLYIITTGVERKSAEFESTKDYANFYKLVSYFSLFYALLLKLSLFYGFLIFIS